MSRKATYLWVCVGCFVLLAFVAESVQAQTKPIVEDSLKAAETGPDSTLRPVSSTDSVGVAPAASDSVSTTPSSTPNLTPATSPAPSSAPPQQPAPRPAPAAKPVAVPATVYATKRPARPDTSKKTAWNKILVSKLAGSQAGYQNWAKGGSNSLALTIGLEGNADGKSGAWLQKHDMRLAFGVVKQDTLEFRKADDVILLNSSLQYSGRDVFRHFNPIIANQIRTQFASGFKYKKIVPGSLPEPPEKVSEFASPLILTQSVGLVWEPIKGISNRLGISTKETVVAIRRFRLLYGVPEDQVVQFETGMEWRTSVDREIVKNVHWKSAFGVFTAFTQIQAPDVTWENVVAMKVNSWLGFNFVFDTLYDRDFSRSLQIKEVFSLGVSIALI